MGRRTKEQEGMEKERAEKRIRRIRCCFLQGKRKKKH